MKKEMLRAAVRENLDLLDGRRLVARRRRASGRRWAVRALFALVLPLLLFVSINAISTDESPTEVLVVTPRPGEPPSPRFAVGVRRQQPIEPSVFRLAVTRVVLDAGHGGTDPGATGFGLVEKDVTLDVARRAAAALREKGIEVVLTREGDTNLSLRERASLANAARGDIFVSIHVNSIPRPERRGVETYWLGPSDDPFVDELAGAENQESGYSLSDFRRLVEGVYAGARKSESRRLAESVQAALFDATRRADPAGENRGVKSAPFAVLVATEMPGVLAEVACLSNEEDARLLHEAVAREGIARAIARGLKSYADAGLGPAPRPVQSVQSVQSPKAPKSPRSPEPVLPARKGNG